jgi:hypothetical protein
MDKIEAKAKENPDMVGIEPILAVLAYEQADAMIAKRAKETP